MRIACRHVVATVIVFFCGVVVVRAAPDEDWYLRCSFLQTYQHALIVSATTLGEAYDQSLREGKTGHALASMFKECARNHPSESEKAYMLVGFVMKDGKMANTRVSPSNDVALCFGRSVDRFAFPMPPAGYVPFAVAIKFDGKTMRQVSPFPPVDGPPGPPH